MYIIAIAWIYVVLLMSFTEESIVAGVATFLFYGVAPLSVLLYLMGTPQRRRNRRRREALDREAGRPDTGREMPADEANEVAAAAGGTAESSEQPGERSTDRSNDRTAEHAPDASTGAGPRT
jgi:hypothetical protein